MGAVYSWQDHASDILSSYVIAAILEQAVVDLLVFEAKHWELSCFDSFSHVGASSPVLPSSSRPQGPAPGRYFIYFLLNDNLDRIYQPLR